MLGLFSKKPPSLDRFPTEKWTVAQCVSDGGPMILRVNSGARKFVAHPELPIRLGVTVSFNQPNEHGFCTSDEGAQLGVIEDRLCEGLLAARTAFPVLVITVGGRREFVFFTRDKSAASPIVDEVAASTSTHKLTYGFLDDSEWTCYTQLR